MSAEADPGLEAVEHVRAMLQPAAAWSAPMARGFEWWPHRLAQRVWAEPAAGREAGRTWRVVAESDLVRHAPGTGAAFAARSAWLVSEPGLSALRWNAEDGALTLRASVIVREADRVAAASRLAHAALLQLGEAERAVEGLASATGGVPAFSPGPLGPRSDPDALISAADAYAENADRRTAALRDAQLALSQLEPAPWRRVRLDGGVLSAELPCGTPAEPEGPSTTALLRVTRGQRHPRYGAGVLTALQLPAAAEPLADRAAATAALLDEGEARERTDVDALGAWCAHPEHGLVHVAFTPALAIATGDLERAAWEAAARGRWAMRFLASVATLRGRGTGA